MDVTKEYLYQLSKIEYQAPYLLVMKEYAPSLFKPYIKMIIDVPFSDTTHHAYYGEIKQICTSFLNCFSAYILGLKENCEMQLLGINNAKLLDFFKNTMSILETHHHEVVKYFEPTKSEREEKQLDQIKSLYKNFRAKLVALEQRAMNWSKCDNEQQIRKYATRFIKRSIPKTYQIGEFTRGFTATMLADRLFRIRVSIDSILHRLTTNLTAFQASYNKAVNSLFDEMYERNKERMDILRRARQSENETAEIDKKIDTVRVRIENFGNFETFDRLNSETQYWTKKKEEFELIAASITKVKTALEEARKSVEMHERYHCKELPGSRATCWDAMSKNYKRLVKDLEEKYTRVCLPFYILFIFKGIDRILYRDAIGSYHIDEFGYQNYATNFGAKNFHVNCDGEFLEIRDDAKYYFDECGRYHIENGEKVYQLTSYSNKYKINNTGLFEKVTPCECKEECQNERRVCLKGTEAYNMELFPKKTNNIEGTLDSETAKYLWNTFGYILPELICEVAESHSKNPIHEIARVLINRKHKMTANERQTERVENAKKAQEYRNEVYADRLIGPETAVREWKTSFWKHFRSDDFENPEVDEQELNINENQ